MRLFLTILAALLIALSVSQCDSSGHVDPEPETNLVCTSGSESDVLLPLRVGNYWEFHFQFVDTPVSDSARWAVASQFPESHEQAQSGIFGIHWYDLERAPPEGVTLYELKETGLFQRGVVSTDDSIFVDTILYPFPAEIGAKGWMINYGWDVDRYVIRDSTVVELVEKDVTVETFVATYSTIAYRWLSKTPQDIGADHWIYEYYAPGFGFVSREVRDEFDLTLLASWTLKRLCILQNQTVTE